MAQNKQPKLKTKKAEVVFTPLPAKMIKYKPLPKMACKNC